MGGDQPNASDLSSDGVRELRNTLREKFAGDAVIDAAVDGVLAEIQARWDDTDALPAADYELLSSTLGPHLRRLLGIPVSDAKPTAEALVREWAGLRGRIKWS
jgi:hypothetical protein